MISEIENESMAPKAEIDMIVRAFEHHDLNQDGYLTKEELKTFIQKMGKIKYFSISPLIICSNGYYSTGGAVSDEHVAKLFDEADVNKDGKIDTEEFIQVLRKNSR